MATGEGSLDIGRWRAPYPNRARLYIASCDFIQSHRRKDRAGAGAAEVCGLTRPINRSAICLS